MGASNTKCSDLDGTVYTQIEIDNYQLQRKKLFMSTIIICFIYAILSLILILLGSFTNIGKELIFITYLPFTIIFIIGSIIIILYFSNKINKFKPYKLDNTFKYDNNSCPDYWNLVKTKPEKDDILINTPNDINSGLLDYKCEANPKIYKKSYMLNKLNNDPDYNPSSTKGVALNSATIAKKYGITGSSDTGTTYYNSLIKSSSSESYDYNDLEKIIKDDNHLFANLNKVSLKDDIKQDFNKTALNMAGFKTKEIGGSIYGAPANTDSLQNYNVKVVANTLFGDDVTTNRPKVGGLATDDTLAVPLLCDKLYPKLLASKDDKYNKDNPSADPNPYRCAYSKICGVSWSDVNCAYEKTKTI